jgi:hypothetical protein
MDFVVRAARLADDAIRHVKSNFNSIFMCMETTSAVKRAVAACVG